jgi:hypothetical protein
MAFHDPQQAGQLHQPAGCPRGGRPPHGPTAAYHRYPHTDGPDTGLTVYAFAVDPELGIIDTPNGKVVFYQVVGVNAEEKARMKRSSTRDVLQELARQNPLLITEPARA